MKRSRSNINGYRPIVALFLALTLAVRLLVPAGFMPSFDQGRVVLALCGGKVEIAAKPQAMELHGNGHDTAGAAGGHEQHGAKDVPCAFTDLTLASLEAADLPAVVPPDAFPPPPAVAEPAALASRTIHRLRPPARAPPTIA